MSELKEVLVPGIFWNVTGASDYCKKKSQPFSILGHKWKLKFFYASCARGDKYMIILKRLGDSVLSNDLLVTANFTSIRRVYLTQSTNLRKGLDEWIIWEQTSREIVAETSRGAQDLFANYYFHCTVTLMGHTWKDTIDLHGNKNNIEAKPIKNSPCMASLCQDYGKMFNNEFLSDVILNCGGTQIYAHRAVLSGRSEVFATMLSNKLKESRETVIITDLEPTILVQLVRYMYSGEISDLTVNSVHKVYAAADMYGVEALKIKCGTFMVENTKDAGCSQIFKI